MKEKCRKNEVTKQKQIITKEKGGKGSTFSGEVVQPLEISIREHLVKVLNNHH